LIGTVGRPQLVQKKESPAACESSFIDADRRGVRRFIGTFGPATAAANLVLPGARLERLAPDGAPRKRRFSPDD